MNKYFKELEFLAKQQSNQNSGSSFWSSYQKQLDYDLKKFGFEDLRNGNIEIARSFGVFTPNLVSKQLLSPHIFDRIIGKLFGIPCRFTSKFLINNSSSNNIDNYIKNLWEVNNVLMYRLIKTKYPNLINKLLEDDLPPRAFDWVPVKDKFISAGVLFKLLHFGIIDKYFSSAETYLEIGTGIGYLPFVIKSIKPNAKIVLVDLPEQLASAYYFLDQRFPNQVAPFSVIKENLSDKFIAQSDFSFFLVSSQHFSKYKISADVGIGTATFQEMNKETVISYMDQLNECIKLGCFIYGGDGLKSKSPNQIEYVNLPKIYMKHLSNFEKTFHGEPYFSKQASGVFLNYAYTPIVLTKR